MAYSCFLICLFSQSCYVPNKTVVFEDALTRYLLAGPERIFWYYINIYLLLAHPSMNRACVWFLFAALDLSYSYMQITLPSICRRVRHILHFCNRSLMRTYIFTKKERQTIINFLIGSIPRSNPNLIVVICRMKHFADLASDIDLYNKLRETIATNTA